MSGKLLRLVCIAATAAGTVLAPVPARAVPEPDTAQHDTEERGTEDRDTEARDIAPLLTGLQKLYRKAEEATEAYNGTEEKLKKQRAETDRLDRALARARLSLHDSRGAAGRLARQQYQSSTDISPYVRLLLARDPQHAIEQGHVIGRLAQERADTIGRLTGDERTARELARKARTALDRQLTLTERRKKERDEIRARLREVEELLASLSSEQLTDLAEFEQKGIAKAQKEFMASGALGDEDEVNEDEVAEDTEDAEDNGKNRADRGSTTTVRTPTPSAEGHRAVRYAVRQLGKPYEWGAEGPRTYDCSGLTSQAWAEAGTPIPRTSQEQWKRLERIPLDELRPGDLVVYFPKATHVALYLGDGMVVQAPRPGAKVKVSPIVANPVLGAVRPDPGGEPLRRYEPPKLPKGATDGSDEGYEGDGGYAAPAPDTSAR
ncbi:Cell wall-associated hydrolase, NlpC family [Streptomyces sp. Ag82_O1-12]|uniref:C40 family peptidase n=1 Tax=unclassified Streptomyces TaxID=2593676 RepID=UPI000BCF605A|nr:MULTISPECIES: NlpC/P60 family protein [unclassified Streptomyces]SMQ18868.1 Cell wall-associated hydrolase, NlpC family [Streptomyces sp. Ag82_O1-12]SOD47908.1 Cell wall-associated hydrolase, NlpC family [Streptomyces sp. Ag82_G6-1]